MSALWRQVRARMHGETGMTLVELLVASLLFLILGSMLFGAAMTSARTARNSREYNDLNEEARVVLNRVSREMREASSVQAVQNAGGQGFSATSDGSVTFHVDFNGNGVIEPSAADPEELTYYYDYVNRRLLLRAGGLDYPILAANVSAFKITYTSRLYQFDGKDGTVPDGIVDWWELDADRASPAAPCNGAIGNCNGVLDQELSNIDSVTVDLTVLTGSRRQDYRTKIDLRNRPV